MTESKFPAPPKVDIVRGPYGSSYLHLVDELERVEVLVRAQVIRWLMLSAGYKDAGDWGMVNVSEDEIWAYLRSEFVPPAFPQTYNHATARHTDANHALPLFVEAAERMRMLIDENLAKTPGDVELRLKRLQKFAGLSPVECDVLLIALLPEFDGRYRRLFGYLQDDVEKNRPPVDLIWRTLSPCEPDPARLRASFESRAPLLRHRLIVLDHGPGDQAPLPWRLLRLDDRVAAYLLGDDGLDGRLSSIAGWAPDVLERGDLDLEAKEVDELLALAGWLRYAPGALVLLHGPRGSGRLRSARFLAAGLERPLLIVDVPHALRSPVDWGDLVAFAYREAALAGAAIVFCGVETLIDREPGSKDRRWETLIDAADEAATVTIVTSQTAWHPLGRVGERPFVTFNLPMPNFAARRRIWLKYLKLAQGEHTPDAHRERLADELAGGFQLSAGQIRAAIAAACWLAIGRGPEHPKLTRDALFEACRRQSGGRLSGLARRIEPRANLTFESLIVPPPIKRQLLELWDRVRLRGRFFGGLDLGAYLGRRGTGAPGLVTLFTGPSGTGKTMAAEVLAHAQGVDLYKVDLASLISKWLGETEKNLSALFDEAESANAVILFDEADSLFGKRGEVKEAQDRWANLETNYLLQRIEEYAGVVVLTTNLRQNIDEAFLRRIHTIVEFPLPDAAARLKILSGLLALGLPHPSDTDLAPLVANFDLPGGSLTNVVTDATFRALARADRDTHKPPTEAAVTIRDLVLAVAREYQKLGKPITKSVFPGVFYQWVEQDIFMIPAPAQAPGSTSKAPALAPAPPAAKVPVPTPAPAPPAAAANGNP